MNDANKCPECGSTTTIAHTDEELRRRHKLVRQCFDCDNFWETDWEVPEDAE